MQLQLSWDRKLAGAIFGLAWPVAISSTILSASRLVEIALLGQLGARAVAAVGVGFQVTFPLTMILDGLFIGCRTFVAQAVGGGRHGEAEEAVAQSFLLAAFAGLTTMLVGFGLGPNLARLVVGEMEPQLAAETMWFLRLLPLAFIPWFWQAAFAAVLSGAGDTRRPLALDVVMWTLVLGWDWLVLAGPLAPLSLGAGGVALGRLWSRLATVLLGLGLLLSGRLVLKAPRRLAAYRPNPRLLRRILRVSLPTCGTFAIWALSDTAFYSILARAALDPAEKSVNLAAYSIGGTVGGFLIFGLIGGFGTASSVLVGQSQGAGRPEEAARRGWTTGAYGLLVGAILGLSLLAAATPLAALFNRTGDRAVTNLAALLLVVQALVGTITGLIMALEGGLMGAGDTGALFLLGLVNWMVVRLGLSALLVFGLGWGIKGAFWALGLTHLIYLGMVGARFASGKWKAIRV